MILSRRKLIGGIGLLIAAPAIVRAENLMPIKVVRSGLTVNDWNRAMSYVRSTGFDVIHISPSDVIRAAEYEWVQASVEIDVPYKRMLP